MEVSLGPGHTVLDGDPAPPKGVEPPPIYRPCMLWPNGWMHKMPFGMEVDLGTGNIVLDRDPAPPKRGTAPNFRPMSVVAKLLDASRCHLEWR